MELNSALKFFAVAIMSSLCDFLSFLTFLGYTVVRSEVTEFDEVSKGLFHSLHPLINKPR